jgi:hypothetical protein
VRAGIGEGSHVTAYHSVFAPLCRAYHRFASPIQPPWGTSLIEAALFGEQVTKHYLSESLHLLDYIFSAMAPLDIPTAVVFAIRASGSSAKKVFVGRAQESRGTVEAELILPYLMTSVSFGMATELLASYAAARLWN